MYKKLIKINFYKNPAILIPFIFFITIFFFGIGKVEIGVGIIFLINLPMIITKWESFMRTKKNIIYAVMLLVMAIFFRINCIFFCICNW